MRVGRLEPYGEEPGSKVVIDGHTATVKQRRLRFSINARDFQRVVGFNHSERQRKLKRTIKGRRWTPWPPEKRKRVLELVEAGVSVKEAARLEGVPASTVYFWVKKGTRTWREYEAQGKRPQPPLFLAAA